MSDTPRTDKILANQSFKNLDEATECLNEWVEFARILELEIKNKQKSFTEFWKHIHT